MKKLLVLILTTALLLCFGISASAVDEPVDLNKKCSLTVTMSCAHGYKSGGKVYIYYVASAQWEKDGYVFLAAEDFKDCAPEELSNTEAERLSNYAKENNITGELQVLEDGTATFRELPVGLYLVVHEEPTKGFTKAMPFFVTLPISEGDVWNYDVNASPKVEITHSNPPPPPSIPQTGQLQWPVPVMAFSGIILFSIGWVLFRRNKA